MGSSKEGGEPQPKKMNKVYQAQDRFLEKGEPVPRLIVCAAEPENYGAAAAATINADP